MRTRRTAPEMVGKCRVISSSGGGGAPLPAKVLALGRLKAGEMNQTEASYGAVLERRRIAGEVVWYRFEGINLRLADNTHYRPDFAVQLASGVIEIHEVKGHWTDDARVKIKVAADQYPFRFVAVTKKPKGGGWSLEEF
jgi:hypothetical protein